MCVVFLFRSFALSTHSVIAHEWFAARKMRVQRNRGYYNMLYMVVARMRRGRYAINNNYRARQTHNV